MQFDLVAECWNTVPVAGRAWASHGSIGFVRGVSKDVVLGLVWCSLGAKRKININFNHSDGENLPLPKQNTGSTYPGGLFLQCTGMKDMYQHFSFQSFNLEKQFSMITTFQPGMVSKTYHCKAHGLPAPTANI